MQSHKGFEGVSIVQAVDTLSYMAEIDLVSSGENEKKEGLTQDQIQERMQATTWLDPSHTAYNQERVKETFQVILDYLKGLVEKDKSQLSNELTQRGIQAIILLATEAAEKLDRCTDLFQEEDSSALELKEYKELMKFYQTKILHRFLNIPDSYENWKEEWGTQDELLPMQKKGLKSLASVRKDKEYELFYIRREDGCPFFNRSLLRHIQLVGKFDSLIIDPSRDDLFLKMKVLKDREAHHAAQEILHLASLQIEEYFKDSMKHKQNLLVTSMNKALMALMLAANTANLIQNTNGKSSKDYFKDFHFYLRKALQSEEYRVLASKSKTEEHFSRVALNMIHFLSALFFLNSPQKKEAIKFIHTLIERGEQHSHIQKETRSPSALFNNLTDDDELIRSTMRHYPNGPLMKTLEIFKESAEMSGFDPFLEENTPHQLYAITGNNTHVTCLHLPAPLSQKFIRNANVSEEFYGFLRHLKEKKQRHLLVNLQDRTSWQEHARAVTLEEFTQNEEFSNTLTVVTLPKSGDFYWQSSVYQSLENANDFIEQFKEQIASGEQCGFFFPKEFKHKEMSHFIDQATQMIHQIFFGSKEMLTHKNRLDFIEILYLLFSLKMIKVSKCDSISFTSKDAIDAGAVHSSELYLFLKMIQNTHSWTSSEKDFLYWMLYSPALINRWRPVDQQALNRMQGALSTIGAELEAHHNEVMVAMESLLGEAINLNSNPLGS